MVLEVTEHVAIENYAAIRAAVSSIGADVRIAVDDAGAGFASFRHILELRPDLREARHRPRARDRPRRRSPGAGRRDRLLRQDERLPADRRGHRDGRASAISCARSGSTSGRATSSAGRVRSTAELPRPRAIGPRATTPDRRPARHGTRADVRPRHRRRPGPVRPALPVGRLGGGPRPRRARPRRRPRVRADRRPPRGTARSETSLGPLPSWFTLATTVFLLAQPVFSLKLVSDIRGLPAWLLPLADRRRRDHVGADRGHRGDDPGRPRRASSCSWSPSWSPPATSPPRPDAAAVRPGSAWPLRRSRRRGRRIAVRDRGVGGGPARRDAAAWPSTWWPCSPRSGYWIAFLPPRPLRAVLAGDRRLRAQRAAPRRVTGDALVGAVGGSSRDSASQLTGADRRDRPRPMATACRSLRARRTPSRPARRTRCDPGRPGPGRTSRPGHSRPPRAEPAVGSARSCRSHQNSRSWARSSCCALVRVCSTPTMRPSSARSGSDRRTWSSVGRFSPSRRPSACAWPQTIAALEAASAAKSDFLASMSHELRTPLNAIIGFSSLMASLDEVDGALPVPREWVEHIRSGGDHLLSLINDVLDLAKVEAGRLELAVEAVDVGHAIAASVAGLRPLADRKRQPGRGGDRGIDRDRRRSRPTSPDPVQPAVERDQVHAGWRPHPGQRLPRRARGPDRRPGQRRRHRTGRSPARVFEEFRQVGDTAQHLSGHGSGAGADQAPRRGARRSDRVRIRAGLRLHLHRQPPGSAGARDGRGTPSSPRSSSWSIPRRGDVLVIEDEPSSARLLQTYLVEAGYRVRMASNGETGLAMVRARRPAAIVLDVLLPGIDGWEVLRQLKSDPALRDVPVIIATVVDERGVGLALGAVDYLVKPVDPRGAARSTRALRLHDQGQDAGHDRPGDRRRSGRPRRHRGHPRTARLHGPACVFWPGRHPACDGGRARPRDLRPDDARASTGSRSSPSSTKRSATSSIPILVLTAQDLSAADKARLNGRVLGIAAKGSSGTDGLSDWLGRVLRPIPMPAASDHAS